MTLLPVDLLMSEHRLIERMITLTQKEIERVTETREVNPNFIIVAVDFFRSYADRCHHGKEEGILFKGLSQKQLANTDDKMMRALILEHAYARKTVSSLESFKESYVTGNIEASKNILQLMKELVEFYPVHIKKEDTQFFYPSMSYFTPQEQEEMLREFLDFDRNFIHKKYQQIINTLERAPTSNEK